MADLVASLTPLPSAPRADRVTFKLLIENKGETPAYLTRIDPLVGEGITVPRAVDLAQVNKQGEIDEELRRLTRLYQDYEVMNSGAIRDKVTQAYTEVLTEAISTAADASRIGTLPRALLRIGSGRFAGVLTDKLLDVDAFLYDIEDVEDARRMFEKALHASDPDSKQLHAAYERVLLKAERLQRTLPDWLSFATVNPAGTPGATYEAHFDVSFRRSLFDPTTRTFSVRTGYVEDPSREATVSPSFIHASATHSVSPNPWVLSGLTICWAILGLILSTAMISLREAADGGTPMTIRGVLESINGAEWLAAPILALIIFNVYENLDIGKRIQMTASWRSALLIGALSGLFGERILESLAVLIGV